MPKHIIAFLLLPILLGTLFFSSPAKVQPRPSPVSETAAIPVQKIPDPDGIASTKQAITIETAKYPAKRISEHQWTLDIAQEIIMATPQEIFGALNNYRLGQGKNALIWDDTLANFAQDRAAQFAQLDKLDDHKGFYDFIYKQNGFPKMGFYKLGENSSFAYKLSGTRLIEEVFAGDKPHDDNQLDPIWTHVGIGVANDSTDIIFGGYEIG